MQVILSDTQFQEAALCNGNCIYFGIREILIHIHAFLLAIMTWDKVLKFQFSVLSCKRKIMCILKGYFVEIK